MKDERRELQRELQEVEGWETSVAASSWLVERGVLKEPASSKKNTSM